ncbi:MAG TPA: ferritin-like domain-containing protein [Solirubrobacterales bacterium]|jgi:rubrerythrin|nr:ferritin-like domain-containing protein [Solirubrobacterales bacterium]
MNDVRNDGGLGAVEVEPINRSALLVRGALAAGALYGSWSVSPLVRRAFAAQGSMNDVDILNFALTLEYLEAAFYSEAAKQVPGLSGELAGYVKAFGAEEQDHVDALSGAIKDLGGKPVEAPGVDFGDAFSSTDSFLELAITFEDTGVSAYNGAAPMIDSKDLLAVAGSIVQVEARHAAAVRHAAGEPAAPNAFDPTLGEDEVLKAVQPFIA